MAVKFQLTQQTDTFSFNLVDEDGNTLLMGGEFNSRDDAKKTIDDVRVGSLVSQQIAASRIPSGETFFVIKNTAGQIIAKSLLFEDQMVFDNTLHHVKDGACIAEIIESI